MASAPPEPRWGVADAVLGYLAGILGYLVVSGVWIAATGDEDVTLGLFTVGLLGQWAGLVGAVVLVSRRRGSASVVRDFGLGVRREDIVPGIVAGVLSQLVLVPLLYLPFELLMDDLDLAEEAREVTDLAQGGGLVVLAVLLVLGAPLVEELFFRGLLRLAVERRHGPRWGIGVSAVVFGVTHFQPLQLLGLVAFGVVLGVLAHRAGRLGPAIVAHMAFNATTVAVLVATR